MRLLLIRHGETVDNVAGNFAGITDSALTAHGVLQAERLATHLVARFPVIRGIFTSDLQRAARTGGAIHTAAAASGSTPPIVTTPLLRERDFGPLEGVSFRTCKVDIEDVAESHASMRMRAQRFLDEMVLPWVQDDDGVYVVVAHGLLLPKMYACLVEKSTVTIDAAASAGAASPLQPWWSNTAYLECVLAQTPPPPRMTMHVLQVNCTTHVKDLKRTRGGIGSAAHDDRQKKIESYFGGKKL